MVLHRRTNSLPPPPPSPPTAHFRGGHALRSPRAPPSSPPRALGLVRARSPQLHAGAKVRGQRGPEHYSRFKESEDLTSSRLRGVGRALILPKPLFPRSQVRWRSSPTSCHRSRARESLESSFARSGSTGERTTPTRRPSTRRRAKPLHPTRRLRVRHLARAWERVHQGRGPSRRAPPPLPSCSCLSADIGGFRWPSVFCGLSVDQFENGLSVDQFEKKVCP